MNGHPPCPHPPTPHLPPLLPGSDIPRGALLFQSDDLEHARTGIGRIYRPYRFTAGERRTMPVTMFKLDGNGMALTWFAYGTDISIRPEICGNFALVLTTLAGHSEARSGRVEQVGGTGSTVLVASNAQSAFRYSADNVQLGMRIDAGRVADIWRSIAGREPPAALRAMQLPRAEEILLMSLVGEQLTDTLPAEGGIASACVRRAVAFIEEHAERPLTLTDIAAASHCSVRTLHRAFRQWRDVGVMRHLKDVRLRRVRWRCTIRTKRPRSPRSRRAGDSRISGSSPRTTGKRSTNGRRTRARSASLNGRRAKPVKQSRRRLNSICSNPSGFAPMRRGVETDIFAEPPGTITTQPS